MLAMFNVTFLSDFGYPEKTHFIDPMEQRYRSKPVKAGEFQGVSTWGSGEFSQQGVSDKVDWFADLEAYKDIDKVEVALEEYWGRTTLAKRAVPAATAAPRA
jgi:bilirubin oxidase